MTKRKIMPFCSGGGGGSGSGATKSDWETVVDYTYTGNTEITVTSYAGSTGVFTCENPHGLSAGDELMYNVDRGYRPPLYQDTYSPFLTVQTVPDEYTFTLDTTCTMDYSESFTLEKSDMRPAITGISLSKKHARILGVGVQATKSNEFFGIKNNCQLNFFNAVKNKTTSSQFCAVISDSPEGNKRYCNMHYKIAYAQVARNGTQTWYSSTNGIIFNTCSPDGGISSYGGIYGPSYFKQLLLPQYLFNGAHFWIQQTDDDELAVIL